LIDGKIHYLYDLFESEQDMTVKNMFAPVIANMENTLKRKWNCIYNDNNDIQMLQAVDHGIALGNASDSVKEKASDNHNWIDIEKELADFAIVRKRPATDLEKKSFFALQSSLCSYIKDINYQHIDSSSKAIRLLKILPCFSFCL